MQHSDDRPTISGRPSLLSSDQQAEADRHRILSGLDGKPDGTTAGAEKARRGKLTWLAAGAAVLALSGGAAAWLSSEGEKEIVLAGSAPLPSSAAPAAALTSEPMAVPPPADVSTAAILEDMPLVGGKDAAVDAKKQAEAEDELNKMLAPAAPARVAVKAAPKKQVVVAKAAAPVKVAEKPRMTEMAMNVEPVLRKKPVAKKPAAPADNDVALLAALVAHSKSAQPKRGTGPAAQLQHCKTLGSVAEAEQCRARLCAGTAKKEAECKVAPNLAKASSES